jgi:catechol 2,3-dioxygenase-like lactoylglutathione lyase family enzyme
MFTYEKTFSSFSVNDLEAARSFYQTKLGLSVRNTTEGGLLIQTITNSIFIYPKPNHVPATYTILNFQVSDVEAAVDELTGAGVTFLQYEAPMKTDEKGIFRGRGPAIAWFSDPAGNIMSILESRE